MTKKARHIVSVHERRGAVPPAQAMAEGTCVVVGDDQELVREAEALAVERLGCKLLTGRMAYAMSVHGQGASDAAQYEQRCRALLHLLTDIELLAHTDYFVGAACLRSAAVHCHVSIAQHCGLPRLVPGQGALAHADMVLCTRASAVERWLDACLRRQQVKDAPAGRMQPADASYFACKLQPLPADPPCILLVCTSARLWCAGSFTCGLVQLVDKIRYTLYGKHRRTTFDASAGVHPSLEVLCPA